MGVPSVTLKINNYKLMKQLVDFFRNNKVTSVLDVGTGNGDFINVLKRVFPNAIMTGVDPDQESLNSATEKFTDVIFRKMTGEDLEFPAHSFDLACISMALHHLTDTNKVLLEMQRVLKPGGWIIVNELFSDNLNPAQQVHRMFHHFRSSIDRLMGVTHYETFKKKEILKLVENAGVDILMNFENSSETDLITDSDELEKRVEKMKLHLENIKDKPEYFVLKPQVEAFREAALIHGFQTATRIVIVGRVKN